MKRKLNFLSLFALMAMAFSFIFVSCEKEDMTEMISGTTNDGIVAYNTSNGDGCEPLVITLFAGQDIDVGTVTVENDGVEICVTYALNQDALDEGWRIYETHLAIANNLEDIPTNRSGNPIPGQFPYGDDELEGVEFYKECISLALLDLACGDEVYIAAHAVIKREECELISETPYSPFEVVKYSQGLRKDKSPVREGRSDPDAVLTYDLGQQETNFFSLGFKFDGEGHPLEEGGWIIVEFDCPIKNGEGDDIMIVEDTWGTYPLEKANVYVSQDGDEWHYLGVADNTERTVNSIHTESYFDLDDVELEWIKFVKVVDITPIGAMPNDGDGFDLNTIVSLHDCYECITYDETAWGDGDRFVEQGNWATWFTYNICCDGNGECQTETAWGGNNTGGGAAWWYYYDASDGGEQTVRAGQTIDVGTVEVVDGIVTIVLTGGWELQDDGEAVKIKGYTEIPDSRPSAGLFTGEGTYKGTDLTGIEIGIYNFYAIHLDVQLCQ